MEDEGLIERFPIEPPRLPPRPIFPKNRADNQIPKIATLQMIQQRGGLGEDAINADLTPLFKAKSDKGEEADKEDNSTSVSVDSSTSKNKSGSYI